MNADDVENCRDLCIGFLTELGDRDWSTTSPGLEFSVGELVAHQAQALFWYSLDLSARGHEVAAAVPTIAAEQSPAMLTETLRAAATMLAAVVRSAPDEARGFHPFGRADASGFAAMACDEMIVHTHDIARGLDVDFSPPAPIATALLARLFPWIEGDEDPWTLLQFANGRIALDGRAQLSKWLWHCAPLAEWDGTWPTAPPTFD